MSDVKSILMVDIDHFKQVNDSYGHVYGDAVLRQIAKSVILQLREHDRVARWGGDEFVIFLRTVRSDQVLGIAERIRDSAAKVMHQAGAPNKISVTVSIGVVSTEKGSLIDAVGAADKALYQAKKEGRNEVVVVVKDDVSI